MWFLGIQLDSCHPSGAYNSEMALCFSFGGKLVHPASEHSVDKRCLIIWVWFTNVKLTSDYFKIRTPVVARWVSGSITPLSHTPSWRAQGQSYSRCWVLADISRIVLHSNGEECQNVIIHMHLWHIRYIQTPRAYYEVHLPYQFRIMQLSAFNQRQSNFPLPNHVTCASVHLTGKRTWQMLKRDRLVTWHVKELFIRFKNMLSHALFLHRN
jgi:hypothetical protein